MNPDPAIRVGPGLLFSGGPGGVLDFAPQPVVRSPQQDAPPFSISATGPTGPQGNAGTRGPTGPQGLTGPKGTQGTQGPQGATGPIGANGSRGPQGDRGSIGPTGPKDSIVETTMGIYAFACIEGARPWFVDITPSGKDSSNPKFEAAVAKNVVQFKSICGGFVMSVGVRKGFEDWNMPEKNRKQMDHMVASWSQFNLPE